MKGLISVELAVCALANTEKDNGLISGELALHAEIDEDNGLISGEPARCAHTEIDEDRRCCFVGSSRFAHMQRLMK